MGWKNKGGGSCMQRRVSLRKAGISKGVGYVGFLLSLGRKFITGNIHCLV